MLPLQFLIPAVAQAATFTPLTLQHGWTGAPLGTSNPAVANISGIIHFRGAMSTTGTNPIAFTLPKAFRPAAAVSVPVDLCAAAHGGGRLLIQPNGVVTVQAETTFADAQCSTSLDGASFAKNANLFTPLTLRNGWTGTPFGTSSAAVRAINGVVHFKGAIATGGTNPFPLPCRRRSAPPPMSTSRWPWAAARAPGAPPRGACSSSPAAW